MNLNHRAASELHRALSNTGLSQVSVLNSTGIAGHFGRLSGGLAETATIVQYAADLAELSAISAEGGEAIPADFWDVRPSAATATWNDEYSTARNLVHDYSGYVRLLGASFRKLVALNEQRAGTAVSVSLAILADAAAYVRSGGCVAMTDSRRGLCAEQQAIFLWQQIVSGTNRQIPYLHRDAYSHGRWSRFNVVEMLRYRLRRDIAVDEAWGLTGFAIRFIGDSSNTNQIEHMAISAVAQSVLRIPTFVLDIVEELEWLLRKGTREASRADERVNRAVSRCLLKEFQVDNPGPACARLQQELAS